MGTKEFEKKNVLPFNNLIFKNPLQNFFLRTSLKLTHVINKNN